MGVSRTGAGLVLLALMAGCASGGEPGRTTPVATATTASSPSVPAPSDVTQPLSSPNEPEGGPAGGIPADLVLPGEAQGQAEPPTDAGRLYDYICLDPEQQWVLGMGFVEAHTVVLDAPGGDATTIERLVAYRTADHATRAVRGLMAQVDMCGDGLDHGGHPSTWRASETTGPSSADESLRLIYRNEGVVSTVVTLVRVGRAVFYVDRRQNHAAGVPRDRRAVAEFVPALATAFR